MLNRYITLAKYIDEVAYNLALVTRIDKESIAGNLHKLIEKKIGLTVDELVKHTLSMSSTQQEMAEAAPQ
jgi:DNA topoisomerase-6 subunit B